MPQLDSNATRAPLTGASARPRERMVRTAVGLIQRGKTPSVGEGSGAAGVSRATAYRYFPSQSAPITAVVDHALRPILEGDSPAQDAEQRVSNLMSASNGRILEFEATFKTALGVSLAQWAQKRCVGAPPGTQFQRGHRIKLSERALSPLSDRLTGAEFGRLAKALSLTFGLEVILVLNGVWQIDVDGMQDVAVRDARPLVRAAVAEAEQAANGHRTELSRRGS